MSKGMNHEKINMQKRIANENLPPRFPFPLIRKPTPKAPPLQWMTLDETGDCDATLPELPFRDPHRLFQLHRAGTLIAPLSNKYATHKQQMLAHQLEAVVNRAMHILPPDNCREGFQFVVMVDRRGVFEAVELVLRGNTPDHLSAGSRIVDRLNELDITLPYRYRKPKLGMKRMAKCLRCIFFRDRGTKACAREFQRFFFAPRNFNLADCGSHTSLHWCQSDHVKLLAAYHRRK